MVIGRILPRSSCPWPPIFSRAIPERDAAAIRCTTQAAAQESARRKGLDTRAQKDGQHSRPPRKGSHSLRLAARPLDGGRSFGRRRARRRSSAAVSCPPPSQQLVILTLQESRQVHKKKMLSKALLLAGVAGATAFTAPSLPMTTRAAKSATSGKHQIHMHPTYVVKPGTHSPSSILRRRCPPRRQSFSRKRVAWSAAKPLATARGHDSTVEKLPAFFSSGSSVRFVTNPRGICRSRTCPTSSVTFSSRGCRVSLGGLFWGMMGGISHWM